MHLGDKNLHIRFFSKPSPLLGAGFIHPPDGLCFDDIALRFDKFFEPTGNPELVPFYHFKMEDAAHRLVGHLNFRIGDTRHIQDIVGHIGYFVHSEFRGNGHAFKACRAVAPFVRQFYTQVIVTAETDAAASIRTIEKLGATYMGEIDVPESDPAFIRGARRKRRYLWTP